MNVPSPVLSIREATLTVSPKRQYLGKVTPTTPAATGPLFRPILRPTQLILTDFLSKKIVQATAPIRIDGFSAQQDSKSDKNFASKHETGVNVGRSGFPL
uniref:Uncharacterized protein n=1 Tax=Romanomermis culicivorax TaxID=13658 RepID=A0A915JHL1_ROMCU